MAELSTAEHEAEHAALPPRGKLIARDLKRTLIHECGHLIVGDHVGVKKSFADFWLYEDVVSLYEHLVGGRAHYFPPLDGRADQLMGVAGLVAESLAQPEDFSALDLLDHIDGDPDAMSATDREGAGEIDEALLDDCAGIIRRSWADLIDEAVHFLGQFEQRYADDAEAVEAASSVRVELEGIRDRFLADSGDGAGDVIDALIAGAEIEDALRRPAAAAPPEAVVVPFPREKHTCPTQGEHTE